MGRKLEGHRHGAHVRDDETQESPIELSRHSEMPHMFETGSTASSLSVHFLVRCKRKRVLGLSLDDDQANALGYTAYWGGTFSKSRARPKKE